MRPRVVHVAIVRREYLNLLLAGTKRTEGRLTVRPIPPWGCVHPGQTVHLKQSGGPYRAVAVVDAVEQATLGCAADVERLRARVGGELQADEAFWASKRKARYATLVRLGVVRAASEGPDLAHLCAWQRRSAWHVLPAGMLST